MSQPEHSDQNIKKLAEEVTDSMEMDAIIQHFYDDQYQYYENDKGAFLIDWKDMQMEVEDESTETGG